MKYWKITTIALFGVLAVALVTASVLAYNYARFGQYWSTPESVNAGNSMPYSATVPYHNQNTYPFGHHGPVVMPYYDQFTCPPFGGWSYSIGGGCMGRMGGWGWSSPNTQVYTNPITLTQAVTIAEEYVTSLNNPDLAFTQVQEYTQTFHVSIFEMSTGIGAFDLLIDKYTGTVYAEMGPNMMWNTKYGMASGFQATPAAVMPVTTTQAITEAQQFLDTNIVGTTLGEVTTYYGYYNIEILYSGRTFGVLSVNGYSGQVLYHAWLGTFIQEQQP